MPTITKYRLWCSSCQEWQLFLHKIFSSSGEIEPCPVCSTPHADTPLENIPIDKINEQRKRYKEHKNPFNSFFGLILSASSALDFRPPGSDIQIVEHDAGQKAIDKKEDAEYTERQKIRAAETRAFLEEQTKYTSLGRNNVCICGSGKKYKKCCWSKFA